MSRGYSLGPEDIGAIGLQYAQHLNYSLEKLLQQLLGASDLAFLISVVVSVVTK